MNIRRHGMASGIAMLFFLIVSLIAGSSVRAILIALGIIGLVCTALYFHYRRRARKDVIEPVTPGRDDRKIPRDVRVAVIVRDGGRCQLQYPGICLVDKEIDIDHIYPWSLGGSSKDPGNLQCACGPCNRHKSNKVLV